MTTPTPSAGLDEKVRRMHDLRSMLAALNEAINRGDLTSEQRINCRQKRTDFEEEYFRLREEMKG